MSRLVKEVQQLLEERAQDWSPEEREQALRIAQDYGQLMARHVAGEDVSRELPYAKAAMTNLQARATVGSASLFYEALERVVGVLVRGLTG